MVLEWSDIPDEPPALDHVAITGRAFASKPLARAIKSGQWKLNIFYNAATDAKRDFAACVKQSIEWSKAKMDGTAPPDRPCENKAWRALSDGKALNKDISALLRDHVEVSGLPAAAYYNAVAEAERARKKHVNAITSMNPGMKSPRLHFRSMRQPATITTPDFRLYERRGSDWVPSCWPKRRSDSPKATRGRSKVKIAVQGLPRLNVNLSRPIPHDAIVKQVVLTMQPSHGRITAALICEVPTRNRDQLAHDRAWALHAILREMPDGLPAQAAIAWAQDRGIRIRGDDLGISSPSVDDQGNAERRVAPLAIDVKHVAKLQQSLSHKDEVALAALPPEEQAKVRTGKAKPPERSKTAKRVHAQIARSGRTMRNRARTAAFVRAQYLIRDVDIIATDPPEMAKKLIEKGGPAEHRAKASQSKAEVVSPAFGVRRPSDWMMSPAQKRAMRRNMAATSGAMRLRQVSVVARQAGILHVTPGNAGTSSECPGCGAPKDNALSARRHVCDCGCILPRDQASAQIAAARALYALKTSPDPDGVRMTRETAEAATREKTSKRKAAMAAGRIKNRGRSGLPIGNPIPGHKHRRKIPRLRSKEFQTETLPTGPSAAASIPRPPTPPPRRSSAEARAADTQPITRQEHQGDAHAKQEDRTPHDRGGRRHHPAVGMPEGG